jgi:predicted transcriptional regulator
MAREIESRNDVYRLSDEERTAVRAGMDEARRGDFASDEEIEELYRWLRSRQRHSGARA